MAGIGEYLTTSALLASAISIVTINLGYYLGGALKPLVAARHSAIPAIYFRISSAEIVAAIWIAGQVY
jgi:hypothetical protein